MPTCVLELASFPHACFDLAYLLLVLEEEARGFAVACNLSSKGQVTNVFVCGFELVEVISAKLETPEIILGIPWALSLIMIRDSIHWSPILQIISGNDANDMRVGPHNHPGVSRRDAPPPIISDNAGHVVDPTIEIET